MAQDAPPVPPCIPVLWADAVIAECSLPDSSQTANNLSSEPHPVAKFLISPLLCVVPFKMDTARKETPKYCPSHGIWVAKATLRWVQILLGILILALAGALSFGNEVGNVLPFIIASPSVSPVLTTFLECR